MNQESLILKLNKIVIITVAFVVFWIYLGSIINFHQHHLFGRSLMSQGILCKREESFQAAANFQTFPVLSSATFTQVDNLLELPVELTLFTEICTFEVISIESGLLLSHSLRGPPAV